MRPSAFLAFTLVSLALVGCSNSGGGSGGSSSPVSFTTGQAASLVLSEAAFNDASYLNNAGDGLLFNHQKGMDSDGTNLVLADGNNNRVLIWDTAPTANTPPDWVLGQPDFVQTDTNNSSDPLAQLSWPVDVAVGGGKLFVADSENDRVLVWNTIPSSNQAPADYAITGPDLLWPWGLWCDGTKLIVTSTSGGKVLIWNTIPTTGNEAPDLILTSAGEMGTPRTITTDGSSYLMVADHNPTRMGAAMSSGVFYWSTFPTSDVASDSFIQDGASTFWMVGAIDSLSRLFWLTQILYRFDTTPIMSAGGMMPGDYNPDLSCDQYVYDGGDGTDMVLAGGHLYISLTNKNKIVGFGSLPTMSTDTPDFVVGSNSLDEAESSLETRLGYITNPNPVTDGKRLVVGSDFDRKIYIY
ncbi:MAG TPA: hypothetical protein ENJ09_15390, partial [Planctomycetes bacterium]|nr:hypothetical protein [Planctomycetota bacterium]